MRDCFDEGKDTSFTAILRFGLKINEIDKVFAANMGFMMY
ncbi:hypothetical protein FM109_06200 [Vibrio casei]|nr:hypothetical protein FM109_06200 [Vibrio casei]